MSEGKSYNVSVAGHIGVGKTTVANALKEKMGVPLVPEPAGENKYLEDFYENKQRWALPAQLSFMCNRIQHHKKIQSNPFYKNGMIQDRSAFEDRVFADRMHAEGDMEDRDIEIYNSFYKLFADEHGEEVPDVILYLKASTQTILQRIHRRGIESEKNIDAKYIDSFRKHYASFLAEMATKTRVIIIEWEEDRSSAEIDKAVESIVEDIRAHPTDTKGSFELSV